jgi:hypothetical protein
MPIEIKVEPTEQFQALLKAYKNLNAAATFWGIEYQTLRRFVEGEGNLSGGNIARILAKTGLTYEELFRHVEQPGPRQTRV